jgi:rhodanese-related sulfurtransferase
MQLITRDELKQKMESGQPFKLVMTLHESAYRQAHIPNSINIYRLEDALAILSPEDEIIVYCSDEICIASIKAYHILRQHGYENVRRYAGGLTDWANAGYPLTC